MKNKNETVSIKQIMSNGEIEIKVIEKITKKKVTEQSNKLHIL